MSDIDELRQAVEAGKAAFSHMDKQRNRCRKHLISLTRIVEENLREKRVELAQNKIRHERITREYEQLSAMLHSLIVTAEGSGQDSSVETAAPLDTVHELELVSDDVKVEDIRTGLKRLLRKQHTRAPQVNGDIEPPPAS